MLPSHAVILNTNEQYINALTQIVKHVLGELMTCSVTTPRGLTMTKAKESALIANEFGYPKKKKYVTITLK